MEQLKARDENLLSDFNVSVTTVEEVFIKSAESAHRKQAAREKERASFNMGADNQTVDDAPIRQLERKPTAEFDADLRRRSSASASGVLTSAAAMFVKRFAWFRRDIKAIVYIVVVPIVFMALGLYLLTSVNPFNQPFTPVSARAPGQRLG